MKKLVFGRKLSREKASRQALFLSLIEGLVLNGKIVTTKAKAKAILPLVDKLVTLAKKDTLAAKRNLLAKVRSNKKVASILWSDVAKANKERKGGFTRIITLPQRAGDKAEMVRMEFVELKKPVNKEKDEKNLPTKSKTS